MTRAFNNQSISSVIMPRLALNILILCWVACFVLFVRADAVHRRSIDKTPDSNDDATSTVSCECEVFVQSWSSPQMIRLPLGMQEIRAKTTGTEPSSTLCVQLCQKQLPEQSDALPVWNKIYKRACWTLIASEDNSSRTRSTDGSVRGSLQAYSRSSDTHTWTPMGEQYRKILSCSHPRNRRNAQEAEARKVAGDGGKRNTLNSIDAQSVVSDDVTEKSTSRPSSSKRPSSSGSVAIPNQNQLAFNMSTVRTVLKQFGFWGPNVANVVDFLERVGMRQMLERFQLGWYVDRYDRLYSDYAEEMDVGQCVVEHLVYTVLNSRAAFGLNRRRDGRGLREDVLNAAVDAAAGFLQSDHAPGMLKNLYSKVPSRVSVRSPTEPPAESQPPNVQDVALNVARFYLRNYLGSLSGNELRSEDPSNNPDSLADMVEQVSRPLFLSVFGIVPGASASGKLDHLLQVSQERGPESRNKLRLESNEIDDYPYVKTGNMLFDIGNQVVRMFQRGSNPTSGLYCVKQYFVNRVWHGYKGTMRSMMRSIPSSGKHS